MILQKLKTDAEAYLGESVDGGGDHRPRVLQQRAARGDEGRRQDRRPRRPADHQRADRGLARVRARQGGRPDDPRLRPRRRHVRRVRARARRGRLRGQGDRRATTTSAATTSTRRSSTGWSPSSRRTRASTWPQDRMALQRLYEAAEKAKIELSSTMTTQINLPFVTATPEGPKHLDLQLTRAKLTSSPRDLLERTVGPTKQVLADAGLDASTDRPRRARRRHDPHAGRAGEGQGADRQGPAQGRQPGRGRRRRRRDPGRRAEGRGQGRPPARRDAAVARHRDEGRRVHEADRAQHDDPDEEVGDLLDRRGQPAVGRDPRAPGRVGDGRLQQDARQVPARRHPAGAAGHAADRGRVRHRRERDHPRLGEGSRHRATSSRSRSRAARA